MFEDSHDYFHTRAENFFDHDALGNSNIFFPLTIEQVFIRGFEVTTASPTLFKRAKFHLDYSHQKIQGQRAVSGGLTDFSPPADSFFVDHDQRNTLSSGLIVNLSRGYASGNVSYGSGFLKGDGPEHLPSHTTLDFSMGRGLGEKWMLSFHTTWRTTSSCWTVRIPFALLISMSRDSFTSNTLSVSSLDSLLRLTGQTSEG